MNLILFITIVDAFSFDYINKHTHTHKQRERSSYNLTSLDL